MAQPNPTVPPPVPKLVGVKMLTTPGHLYDCFLGEAYIRNTNAMWGEGGDIGHCCSCTQPSAAGG